MTDPVVLVGRGAEIEEMPEGAWWKALEGHAPALGRHLDALPALHRALRSAAVLELVRSGSPVRPEVLSRQVSAPVDDVRAALAELERGLFFLVRNPSGEVSWAFPVTAEVTPHHLSFSSGERLYGA